MSNVVLYAVRRLGNAKSLRPIVNLGEPINSMQTQLMTKQASSQVVVPIAPGFDEESVVRCVSQLRRRGVRVWLVGLNGRDVRSEHGLSIRADKRIQDLGSLIGSMVLLTGGAYSLKAVLDSAEMQVFLDQAGRAGGEIVTTGDSYATVEESGLMTSFSHLRWRTQSGESLPEFLSQVGTT